MSLDDKKKQNGPVSATSTVSGALERLSSSRSRRVEEMARPGETWIPEGTDLSRIRVKHREFKLAAPDPDFDFGFD